MEKLLDKKMLMDIIPEITAGLQDTFVKMDGEQLLHELKKPGMAKLWCDIYDTDTIKIFLHKIKHAGAAQ